MIAVTGAYLVTIVERYVSRTIGFRRNYPIEELIQGCVFDPTNQEIADFILSIPYFDQQLRNFILGFSNEQTIIISQSWEIAFIVQAKKWAESEDWLHGAFRLSMSSYDAYPKGNTDFLTLPY